MTDTLGDRIKARRAARQFPQHWETHYMHTSADTAREMGYGDNPMGYKCQRAVTIEAVTYRTNTADGGGNMVVQLHRNGALVEGASATIAAPDQIVGGTVTGSWLFNAGDILAFYIIATGDTPGTGLIADAIGTINS